MSDLESGPPGDTLNPSDAISLEAEADAPPPTTPPPAPPALVGDGRRPYSEITLPAIVLGIVLGLVMNAAITYAGLKIGFTIGGSAIAAVLGFGVLKAARRGTILETNITQTVASAVNTSNSGVIFTFPVLFLLGFSLSWSDAEFWVIAGAGVAGAVLGAAFIIPLRKQMIDIDRLRFPTGTGVATILKSPGAGPKKAVVLIAGILLSALIYLPVALPTIPRAASIENLEPTIERLLEVERITPADADRARRIKQIIENRSAPETLVERGRVAHELRQARAALQRARADRGEARASGERDAIAEAAAEADRANTRVQELERELAALPREEGPPLNDAFARQVYLIIAGADALPENAAPPQWESLASTSLGWISDPLWGYRDLNLRLPAHYPRESDRLKTAVDHDGDNRPDQVVTDDKFYLGRLLGLPDQIELIFALAPFALGAGFISGRPGLLVLAGGLLAYFVINPVAHGMGWLPQTLDPHQAPGFMFGNVNRPLGIGLLLGGALMGVAASLPSILQALRSVAAPKVKSAGGREELGIGVLALAVVGAVALLFLASSTLGNRPINTTCPVTEARVAASITELPEGGSLEVVPDINVDAASPTARYKGYTIGFAGEDALAQWRDSWTADQKDGFLKSLNAQNPGWLASLDPLYSAIIIAVAGALWIWFAGIIIAQCTGLTDWSPISGLALITVVLVLLLTGTGQVVAAVTLGVALCVAITLSADMMQDLRTGYLVGSRPIKQQSVELAVVGIGPAISMLTVLLIVAAQTQQYGQPLGPGTDVPAPQAQALEAVITGVQGGDIPYALYGLGATLGVLLGVGGFAGLGVLVGLSVYLPFYYIATYGIGCVANMFTSMAKGKRFTEEWGVPFAAGFIVGESVLALVVNIVVLSLG